MPIEWKEAIIGAFRHFSDVYFIWKYEIDDIKHLISTNVYLTPWLPQKDLLREQLFLLFSSFQILDFALLDIFSINILKSLNYSTYFNTKISFSDHKNVKGFITHGGFNSLQEAINSGTPIITIPLFADQYRNGRIAEKHRFGIDIIKTEFSQQKLIDAISQLLNDKRYKRFLIQITISRLDVRVSVDFQHSKLCNFFRNAKKHEKPFMWPMISFRKHLK
jgi:glucuronosyltransferase